MKPPLPTPIVINGWTIFAHPLFLSQVEVLIRQVEALKEKDSKGFARKNATKRLAAIAKLAFNAIPNDPTSAEYRQGATLGPKYSHWFRAKFFMQYRLFFRYHAQSKIIVFGWVNDEDSKRAYSSKDDAYLVFHKMLESGHPPDEWNALVKECGAVSAQMADLQGVLAETINSAR